MDLNSYLCTLWALLITWYAAVVALIVRVVICNNVFLVLIVGVVIGDVVNIPFSSIFVVVRVDIPLHDVPPAQPEDRKLYNDIYTQLSKYDKC